MKEKKFEDLSALLDECRELKGECPVQEKTDKENYCWLTVDIGCPYRALRYRLLKHDGGEVKQYKCDYNMIHKFKIKL